MAYSPVKKNKIVEAILTEYAKGKHTIKSICSSQGITYRTFRQWEAAYQNGIKQSVKPNEKYPNEKQEQKGGEGEKSVKESIPNTISYKEAKESRCDVRKGRLKELAMTALEKYLTTWEVEERSQVAEKNADGTPKPIKLQITRKAHFPPPMLVKFTLEKTDPETFGNSNEPVKKEGNTWIELMKAVNVNPGNNSEKP